MTILTQYFHQDVFRLIFMTIIAIGIGLGLANRHPVKYSTILYPLLANSVMYSLYTTGYLIGLAIGVPR